MMCSCMLIKYALQKKARYSPVLVHADERCGKHTANSSSIHPHIEICRTSSGTTAAMKRMLSLCVIPGGHVRQDCQDYQIGMVRVLIAASVQRS